MQESERSGKQIGGEGGEQWVLIPFCAQILKINHSSRLPLRWGISRVKNLKGKTLDLNLLCLSVKFTRHVLILSFNHASPINFCRPRKSQALISD